MNSIVLSSPDDRIFCRDMLPKVSRTFAACIHLLPSTLEHPVLIAYLLCRIADTCEDTADLDVDAKMALLAHFSSCLDDSQQSTDPLAHAFSLPRTDDEQLTRDSARTLREFHRLPEAQRQAIRPWIQEMCQGMASFAHQHHRARPDNVQALETIADLDRYCYFVAGTVGHLLTDLIRLHEPSIDNVRYKQLKDHATSFGLGLQLTNIIKDVADDRRRGWMFVPRQCCASASITPHNFLDPSNSLAAHSVMKQLIDKASQHLEDALHYCTLIPRRAYRTRLFCLTPLYFAVRTLSLASRDSRLLDPLHKVKITRPDVYRTLAISKLIAPSNYLVRGYYRHLNKSRR